MLADFPVRMLIRRGTSFPSLWVGADGGASVSVAGGLMIESPTSRKLSLLSRYLIDMGFLQSFTPRAIRGLPLRAAVGPKSHPLELPSTRR
jgi:hypothetical protein